MQSMPLNQMAPMQQQAPVVQQQAPVVQQQASTMYCAPLSVPGSSGLMSSAPVDEFSGIDDFLPTPIEAMIGGGVNDPVLLCDAARRELASVADRFLVDPDTEQPLGNISAVIVKCSLSTFIRDACYC